MVAAAFLILPGLGNCRVALPLGWGDGGPRIYSVQAILIDKVKIHM